MRCFVLLAAQFCLTSGAPAKEHIVLTPLSEDTNLPEKALLLMSGGAVENTFYVETARVIQKAATSLRLWVIIPKVAFNLCILTCFFNGFCWPLKLAVDGALDKAVLAGWNRGADDDNLWVAGHSLGGVCAESLLTYYDESDSHQYAGIIYMASTPGQVGFSFDEVPVPIMVLNGELDGLSTGPVGTAATWKQHLDEVATLGYSRAVREKLVVVLPEVNHSNWCPGFDVPKDLPAEVNQTEALRRIGESTAAFLHLHVPGVSESVRNEALVHLEGQRNWTSQLLSPYLQALDMESDASTGGSLFAVEVQRSLSGLEEAQAGALTVEDVGVDSFDELQTCMPQMESSSSVRTCSYVAVPGEELALKISVFGQSSASCSDGNRLAEQIARDLVATSTLERYLAKGRGWCVSTPDLQRKISSNVELAQDEECLRVRSPGVQNAEFLECRLLTPAMAMAWMFQASLRPVMLHSEFTLVSGAHRGSRALSRVLFCIVGTVLGIHASFESAVF